VSSGDDVHAGEGTGERHGRWSRVPGPPLTEAQQRVLVALVDLCPEIHHEAALRPIAERAGLPPGPASLALKGLERRRMAWRHDDDGAEPAWTPTQTGRGYAEAPSTRT
jgi:hypothetical protein